MPQFCEDGYDCLLENVINGVDLVLSGEKVVGRESAVVRSVSDILRHGLRDERTGYWHLVRELTHPEARTTLARSLKHVSDPYDRGSLWVYLMVVEGWIDCYLQCLCNDSKGLSKYYEDFAFVRNELYSARLVTHLSVLGQLTLAPQDSLYEREEESVMRRDSDKVKREPSEDTVSLGDSGVALSFSTDLPTQEDLTPELDEATPDWKEGPGDERFEDGELSRVQDSVVVLRKRRSDGRKRVSFHQDLLDRSPRERPVLERHSLNEEKLSFFSSLFPGLSKDVEKGSEAEEEWAEERGAPEGQEDPGEPEWTQGRSGPVEPASGAAVPAEGAAVRTEGVSGAAVRGLDRPGATARQRTRSLDEHKPKDSKPYSEKLRPPAPRTPGIGASLSPQPVAERAARPRREKKWSCLGVYPGPHPVEPLLASLGDLQVRQEMAAAPPSPDPCPLLHRLRLHLLTSSLYKAFKWTDIEGSSVLVALTEDKLCLFRSLDSTEYFTIEMLLYSQLDTIVCGPCNRVVTFVLSDRRLVTLVARDGCDEFCCALSLRAGRNRFNFRSLPLDQLSLLYRTEANPQVKGCKFYSWVHAAPQELSHRRDRESDLMYLFSGKWLPAHLAIRDRSFELKSEVEEVRFRLVDVTRCDRVPSNRPHTFVISFRNKRWFTLAAADDYEMSDWMQTVLLSSAKEVSKEEEEKKELKYCSLLATSHSVYTAAFPDTITNSLRIADISTLHTDHSYCIIEVDCLEAKVGEGADWLLFFSSHIVMADFIAHLISVRPDIRQVSGGGHPERSRCEALEKQIVVEFQKLMLAV